MRRAFTLVEVVFVIVILGILASIAIPRLFVTRDDAVITKARSDIASIRSAIVNKYNADMLSGDFTYKSLEKSGASGLFANVLQNGGIREKAAGDVSGWKKGSESGGKTTYTFVFRAGQSVDFTYDTADGSFTCQTTNGLCKELAE